MAKALDKLEELYSLYLYKSGGVLPDKFRESDPYIRDILNDESFESELVLFPDGAARLLNSYRRWRSIPGIEDLSENGKGHLFADFCNLCFRQNVKSKIDGVEERYDFLEQKGVTPESICMLIMSDKKYKKLRRELVSAYAIPEFGNDIAFIDFVTNPNSPYRKGDLFKEIVDAERKIDQDRREERAVAMAAAVGVHTV